MTHHRFFEHFNQDHGDTCPICKTSDDKQTLLIPIPGTEEGNIMQAQQFHSDCLREAAYALMKASQNEHANNKQH